MRNDDKGFTIIEIVVVIAILGLLATMLIGSTSYIANSAARGLANSVKTAIGETRIKTMGKQETVLFLYKDAADGKYYKQMFYREGSTVKSDNAEMIGKHHPVVTYYYDDGSGETSAALDSTGLLIGFDRTNGKEANVTMDINGTSMTSKMCSKIEVTGGGTVCNIEIVPATGKVIYE